MVAELKNATALAIIQTLADNMRPDAVSLWRDPKAGERRHSYVPRRSGVTVEDLRAHIANTQPLALYPFCDDSGMTSVAVVDFDDKDKVLTWQQLCAQAGAVADILRAKGLNPWPVRSGSGHGVHLWLTWGLPENAAPIRKLLQDGVRQAKVSCKVDIIPTADHLRWDDNGVLELGSHIALPFSRNSRPIISLDTGQCVEDLATTFDGPLQSDPLQVAIDLETLERDAGKGGAAAPEYGPVDLDILEEALGFIEPNSYDIWRNVGMALKNAVVKNQMVDADAERLWTAWASTDEKFDQRGQDYNWRRFRPNGTMTIGTIFFKAEEGGWKPPKHMQPPTPVDDVPDFIEALNREHFLAAEGGKAMVFKEEWDPVLSRHRLARFSAIDFKLLHSNVKVITGYSKKGTPIIDKLGNAWLDSEFRRQYAQIALMPEGCEPTTYNLWRGWTIEPNAEGSCSIFKDHLLQNVCAGDNAAYIYLWNWCALTLQKPHVPIGTAIVMRGDKGTGKSTFARVIGELFGQHFLQVTSSRDLTGRFNSHLRDCILLFADEAVWAGSKTEESTLKGLITEPYLSIEGKGRDLYQCRNMLHLIIATNNEWSIPAGLDERRFMAISVGNDKKQNKAFFDTLWAQLNNGGKARLLFELLNSDVSKFDPYDVPQTKELLQQKILSLDPQSDWWYEKLDSGMLLPTMDWSMAVPLQALYLDYVQHCRLTGQRLPKSVNFLGNKIRSFLPLDPIVTRSRLQHEIDFQATGKLVAHTVQTFWQLPSLSDCRSFFEKKARATIDWSAKIEEKPVDRGDNIDF